MSSTVSCMALPISRPSLGRLEHPHHGNAPRQRNSLPGNGHPPRLVSRRAKGDGRHSVRTRMRFRDTRRSRRSARGSTRPQAVDTGHKLVPHQGATPALDEFRGRSAWRGPTHLGNGRRRPTNDPHAPRRERPLSTRRSRHQSGVSGRPQHLAWPRNCHIRRYYVPCHSPKGWSARLPDKGSHL